MDEGNNPNVNSEAENSKGTEQTKPEKVNYEELIKTDKELQSFLDSRISSSNKTAIENAKKQWQLEQDTQKTEMNETQRLQYQLKKQEEANQEIQRKLNARDLKDEALKIATSQDTAFDPEFLNLFDYENMTAEVLQEKTKLIKSIQDRIVEKTLNEWSKEKPPYNPSNDSSEKSKEAELRKAFGV